MVTLDWEKDYSDPNYYFWSTTRPWGLGDKKVDELYRSMIEVAFNEDKAIVEGSSA